MHVRRNNYAFIDSHNLVRGIESSGRSLDFGRFRTYLAEKYSVTTAYLFIGFIPHQQSLYTSLQRSGFILKFKPVIGARNGTIKGNVDADLVLQAMIDFDHYDQAIIVTSDGDFYSLVDHLYRSKKLRVVLSPYSRTCSVLLRRSAKDTIVYMDTLRTKLGYTKKYR